MNTYRIVIVHKSSSVAQSLQWCFEQFESDEVITKTSLEPGELTTLQADIVLVDLSNFLRFAGSGNSIVCPVLLLAEQLDSDELLEALYLGVGAVADLRKGPEEVLSKAKKMLSGETDDAVKLINVFIQSQVTAGQAEEKAADIDYGLTAREKEVLLAMRQGTHLKLIAYNTKTSYDTVRTHVKHIYKKLGVMSASEAVIKAMQMNL